VFGSMDMMSDSQQCYCTATYRGAAEGEANPLGEALCEMDPVWTLGNR
jgi:hypothetical protein